MKCYISGRTCTCLLDDISQDGCPEDVDYGDPFRGASETDDEQDFLHEINGLTHEADTVHT
jgi:hypothetical protein